MALGSKGDMFTRSAMTQFQQTPQKTCSPDFSKTTSPALPPAPSASLLNSATVLTYPCSTIRVRQSHRGSAFQGRALERGWPPGGGAKTPEAHLRLVPRLLFSRRFDELGGHVVGQPDSIVGDKEYETRAMHVAGSNG